MSLLEKKKKIFILLPAFLFAFFFVSFFSFAQSSNTSLTVTVFYPQCNDSLDNDIDGFVDFPADVSCFSSVDNYEGYHPECTDMLDNDSDGLIDTADPQCHADGDAGNSSSYDPDIDQEILYVQCNDGIDNDSDTFVDYPADSDCSSSVDNDESHHGGPPPPGDTEPPYIVNYTPANNATGISSSTSVSITFDNTVNKLGGTIFIKESSNNNIFDSIPVLGDRAALSGGRILTLSLVSHFTDGASYYIELPSGMVADGAGNSFAGLSGPSGWKFSITDHTPPVISNVTISPDKNVATLSWNTDESAISAYFWGKTVDYSTGSGADASYSTTHIVVLGSLLPATTYLYKIQAKDISENVSEYTGSFTTKSEDDVIPPTNPSVFTATPDLNFITLTWVNPDDADFDLVKIVRSDVSYPLTPISGDFVYEGTGIKVDDPGLVIGVKYYYTIFAKDTSGNYSSGALASAKIPLTEPPVLPPVLPPVTPPIHGGDGGETPGEGTTTVPLPVPVITPTPVEEEPIPETEISTSPAGLFPLSFSDFYFYLQGDITTRVYPKNDKITIDSNKNTKIAISEAKLPPKTNSVILRIKNLEGIKTESSFLLSENSVSVGREASIDLHGISGSFPVTIDVFDRDEKLLARALGIFNLNPKRPPLVDIFSPAMTEQINIVTENVAPAALPVGIAVGVSQSIVLATNVGSFYDVYLMILKFIGILSGFFRRKKPEQWGVVYDSVTKQPIDPAYVVVEDVKGEKKKKSAITDLDGRYGFLIEPGTYSIVANKTHYKFPSDILASKTRDEMYDNLYFGNFFEAKENEVVRYNIPLDPVEFDWNEFTKNKDHIFNLYSRKEKIRSFIFNTLFLLGFFVSAIATVLSPTTLNLSLFAFYTAITVFQTLWKYKHKITMLRGKDGKPIPFAIVTAELSGLSIPIVKKVTTDILGRFYLLTQPGVYDIKIQEKQPDESYKEVYNAPKVELKKGVLDGDIVI